VNDAVERSFNEPKKRTAAEDHQRVMDLSTGWRKPNWPVFLTWAERYIGAKAPRTK